MRIALGVEYAGEQFYGWQRQQEVPSVQAALEKALAKVADEPISLTCAGRTDAGVHASGQVVHFDTNAVRNERAWTLGVNALLPPSIAVRWHANVADDFHARFSATARRYRYVIFNSPLRGGLLSAGVTHVYQPLDEKVMQRAAQCLVGEHDFSSFRAAQCQSHTPFRNIHFVKIHRQNDYIVVDIQANAFVHHMVRNIVGSLLVVGSGEQNEEWLAEVLMARDRTTAAATAKPNGLYLIDVLYPSELNLPQMPLGPLFLQCPSDS